MPATAITIGNFDGVHLGHAVLVRAARASVGREGQIIAVMFDPHPAQVLTPSNVPPRLSTAEQRAKWLKMAGADRCIPISPTRDFLSQTPEQFVAEMVRLYLPKFVVEGSDFRFGKGRAGSIQTLRDLESTHCFQTVVVEPVQAALTDQSLVRASSTMIRWLIERGRVADAHHLLGRPYELMANVVKGDQRGRTIGMPTVNLGDCPCLLPADGIYAGAAEHPNGTIYPAAISIGTKPSFGENPRTCEAHLIGYDGTLNDYDWTVRLEFHHWLRDQLVYRDLNLLIDQLKRDVANVVGGA